MWMMWLAISGLLTLVVFYGLSIVINMTIRRWWANLVVYAIFLIYVLFHAGALNGLLWVLMGLSLLAVLLAAWNVRQLRDLGYQMFQERSK